MSEAQPIVNETAPAVVNELEKPKTAPSKKKDGRSKQRTPAQLAATAKMLKAKDDIRNAKRKVKEDKKQEEINQAVEKEMTKRKSKPQKKKPPPPDESSSSSSSDDEPPAPTRRSARKKKQPVVHHHNYYYGPQSTHHEAKPKKNVSPKQAEKQQAQAPRIAQPKRERPAIKFV